MAYKGAQRFWLWIVLLHVLLACSDRKQAEGSAARTRQALAVQVSAELDVERYPALRPIAPSDIPIMACGTLRCAIFYKIGDYVHASRIDQSGQLMDRPALVLGRGDRPRVAAAKNDDFVVIWGSSGAYRATRVRGANGQITDFTPNLPQGGGYGLASNGNTWLLAESGNHRVHIKAGDTFANIADPVGAPDFVPTIIGGQGQYLLIYYGDAARISEATGEVLDPGGIVIARYGDLPEFAVQGAYKDGVYLLTWTRNGKIYGSRIRASDGARLDPDDDVNHLSGAKTIASGQSDLALSRVYPWTGSVLVTWYGSSGTTGEFHAARVDVATGARVAGSITTGELNMPTPNYEPYLQGTWGVGLVGTHAVTPLQIQQVPPQITAGTQTYDTIFVSEDRIRPSVASNGSDFFVVWTQNKTVTGLFEVFGSRISSSGQYLDDPPLAFGAGQVAAVAARGADYLVAWVPATGPDVGTIQRRFVTASGQLEPKLPAITASTAVELQLAYNGKHFLLTWADYVSSIKALRLASDATALDAAALTLTSNFDPFHVHAQVSTVADTTPAESMRTFVVAYTVQGAQARLVRSESGTLIEPPSNLSTDVFGGVASDGTRIFTVLGNTAGLRGGFLDPMTGNFQAPGLRPLGWEFNDRITNVWYDGKSFLVAQREYTGVVDSTLALRRYSTSALSALDYSVPGLGTTIVPNVNIGWPYPSVASDGSGRSLYVYCVHDPVRLGAAVKMRLLTNDGFASGSGGTGGSSGSGGTGGSVGEGGGTGSGGSAGEADGSAGASGGTADAGIADSGTAGSNGAAGSSGTSAGAAGSGTHAGRDGSAAGTSNAAPLDDGGCGCRQPASNNFGPGKILLAGLALGLARRRRKRV